MSRYALPCDRVRQYALSIKYYHVAGACRGAPRLVAVSRGGRRILQSWRRSWRNSRSGGRLLCRLLHYFHSAIRMSWDSSSPLLTGNVELTGTRRPECRRLVSQLKDDRRLVCSGVVISFSVASGTTRRCVLRPRGAASCVSIARRRQRARSAIRGMGGENVWIRRGSIGAPSRMSFVHA